MRLRAPPASLLVAASAVAIVCSTTCAASASTGSTKTNEGQAAAATSASAADAAAAAAAASASLLRGADSTGGSSASAALTPISVRGEAGRSGHPNRQLGSSFGPTTGGGGGGSIASVIQGLLSVLDKTEVDSGNGCQPSRPCRLCEGDCDTDDDVSLYVMCGSTT